MTLTVKGGWLDGSRIRKARKPFACQYWRGKANGGTCRKPIPVGAYYVEGEGNGESGRNGVLLQDKYCIDCAGWESRVSVPDVLDCNGTPLHVGDKVRRAARGSDVIPVERRTLFGTVEAVGEAQHVAGLVKVSGCIAWESPRQFEKVANSQSE